MTHIGEEALILHYYGEPEGSASVDSHLAECEECRGEYQKLQRVLNSVDGLAVPERAADFEEQMWRKVAPALSSQRNAIRRWMFPRQWAWVGVAAAIAIGAFMAGRAWDAKPVSAPLQARERILMVAVGDHLERAQLILVELSNDDARNGSRDISFERASAEELLDANRLYRMTALSTRDASTAAVLDDLERVLLEIAHSPSTVSAAELGELKQGIEDRGILMKVRDFGSELEGQL